MSDPRILVIDDSAANLKLLRVLLLTEGFRVSTATNAAEALAQVAAELPDLVLTDVQLPDLNGLELARRLKADPRSAAIPVVAVTAYAMSGDKGRALSAGCDAYVSKPIDTRALPSLLRSLLQPGGTGAL
ncbi:MAG TPA: response regulator [bacterium]|jgi:two-component system cell cycle response regulator DivK|nr:response regulator [bacterium]